MTEVFPQFIVSVVEHVILYTTYTNKAMTVVFEEISGLIILDMSIFGDFSRRFSRLEICEGWSTLSKDYNICIVLTLA